MLNTYVRNTLLLKQYTKVLKLAANYASFVVKDILYESSNEAGTLLMRFAKHIALERQKVCDLVSTSVRYADFFPITDIRYFKRELSKVHHDQLSSIIIFASTYRSNADPAKFVHILNELDSYAVQKVGEMSNDCIFRTLYSFMFLLPNWMTRLDFYVEAMKRLSQEFNAESKSYSKENFVQLCFYLGLSKKGFQNIKFNGTETLAHVLDNHLDHFLPEMGSLDVVLLSNAAYKTSAKIESALFNQRLVQELLALETVADGSDAILITLVKSMRFQRVIDDKVCEFLTKLCKNTTYLENLQPRGLAHIFAYLADALWDHREATDNIIEIFYNKIKLGQHNKFQSFVETIRGKDIGIFLWCCAQLNCNLSSDKLQYIEGVLRQKVERNEFKYFADQLVDACLSLWMLGYKSSDLLSNAIELKSTQTSTQHKRPQPKVDSRLTILLSAAHIEEPAWCSASDHLSKGFQAFDMKSNVRSYLLKMNNVPYEAIATHLKNKGVSAIISNPINGINLPGIYVNSSKNKFLIEFMTPKQTLHFAQQPFGLLRFKLRLLESLGYQTKLLPKQTDSSNDLNDLLQNILQDDESKEPLTDSIKI